MRRIPASRGLAFASSRIDRAASISSTASVRTGTSSTDRRRVHGDRRRPATAPLGSASRARFRHRRHRIGQHRDIVVHAARDCGASAHRPARATRGRSAWRPAGVATRSGRLARAGMVTVPAPRGCARASRSRAPCRTASARARRRGVGIQPDDFREALETAEERRRRRMQVHEHRGGPGMLERDGRSRSACRRATAAVHAAMRQETGRRRQPQQAIERVGRGGVGRQHADAAVRGVGLGDEPRRDRERGPARACRSRSWSSA